MSETRNSMDYTIEEIDQIIEDTGKKPEDLIPLLQAIQQRYNYLPAESLERIVEKTDIKPAEITGVSTFYSQFRTRPAGKHFVKVCIGTACHVMGAEGIYNSFKEYLEIPEDDDTDKDRIFTVEKVACLGCCMLAPAVQIDDITYGFLTPSKVPEVLKDFLAQANETDSEKKKSRKKGKESIGEIRLCLCSSCSASGAEEINRHLKELIEEFELDVKIKNVGCTGMAYQAPLIEIALPSGQRFKYGRVTKDDLSEIVLRHFSPSGFIKRTGAKIGNLLEKLLTDESWEPVTRYSVDTRSGCDSSYVMPQQTIVTDKGGSIAPLDIDEYIDAAEGFKGLRRAVLELKADEITEIVKDSELRGRGGAGFPTHRKWEAVLNEDSPVKYVVCNGDEGDPGAFMDRMILESFPFRVIEGIVTAAKVINAREGYIYIRAEYPLAMERVKKAIEICREKNFLGDSILGSNFSFNLNVVSGAGAFVCGEETALLLAIEGKRGMPEHRPPYPSERGLWDKPTLVNNVETFALIPYIIRKGSKDFSEIGTPSSKGTKAFALAGKIRRSGLIEVPMGITLREIVEDIGGGIPDDIPLKAIQVGGPSGGCVPASLADTPVDYKELVEAGAIMGSGGMVVLDKNDCMVDIARYFMSFTQEESCGKCTFCRIGTKRMLEILTRLCDGKGRKGDIESLEELGEMIISGSLCGLGKTAPNPVLSTIKHFREEYEAHINGKCPAGKCTALISYQVGDTCIGCTLCSRTCPVEAIEFKPYEQHEIDQSKCIRCGACKSVCPRGAIEVF